MRTIAVLFNFLFLVFFCLVMLTDGPPRGNAIVLSIVGFLMPIFNMLVIRVLKSPGRSLILAALACNIFWLLVTVWHMAQELPSHPSKKESLHLPVC